MDRDRFLEFVAAHSWRTARSSPHQYVIRHHCRDRQEFFAAVRHTHEHGEPGWWGKQKFYYYRPGDGFRYWSYWTGQTFPIEETVCFNRAKESGQLRFPV